MAKERVLGNEEEHDGVVEAQISRTDASPLTRSELARGGPRASSMSTHGAFVLHSGPCCPSWSPLVPPWS
eukprot:3306472-Pyramimonas_sp.AAC.1